MTFCDPPGDDGAVGGCAQMMGAPPPQAIGKIQTATGPVTVMDARGAVAQVNVGDPVYRHDTIETGADGAVGITFIDGTAFNLSNNARMALNEFVCDGTSNSALFRLSKGAFSFINGKVAKAGGLRIETPFARIRGAAQDGGIGILTLAALAFSTIREIQAASRSDAFLDDGTITYKDSPHGTFEITTRDGRVIVADDPGETIVVDPAGSVTRLPNSSSRMAELQQAQQSALSTLSLGLGQPGAAPGGSSTDTFNTPLQLQPINFSQPQNNEPGPTHVTINITTTTQGFIEIPQSKPPSAPAPALPPPPESTIAISTIAGDIAIAGVNIINADKANTGFEITGTTSGVANGQTVTLTILDSSGQVKDTYTTMVANNVWSVNVSSPDARSLADGSYTVTAIVSDAPGNQSVQATQTFAVDETLPTVTISGISPDTGSSASDGITNVAVVTVSGTTKANSTVKLFDDGNQAGTAIADSTGHWSVTNVTLSEGVNDLTATATDAAGNVSAVSASFVATLDQDTGEHLAVNFNGLTGGDAVEDQTITAVVTDTDNDVPTSGITYTWQLSHDGGNTWSTVGANTPTYTPGEDDEGGLLKVLASFTDAAGNTESGSSTVGVLPLLTIANNSLLVSPNGSVSLRISLTQEPTPDDTILVTTSFPSSGAHDPTIAAGDHATGNAHTSGGITTYTFSVADVNSGLTFTNHGDPVDTLTVKEILNGNIVATSQTITVTDPPVSGGGAIVSDQPVSATGEDASVQSTPDSALLFKDFAQNYGNNLLHPPAQPENDGVQTVTDGAHPAHPHSDVAQFSDFKSADDASAHLAHATGKDTSVQAPPADNGHHANVDPEINLASIAPNHLPDHPADNLPHISAQLDANELRAVTDGAYPAYPHSDVNQLASFKFADDGSAHPGMVPYGLLTVTPLSSDSSGTHGPTALALANTANVPGTVLSDAALDKFIFAENVGHDTVAGHRPDMTEIDHTVPADIQHLLGTAHETNMVSTLDPNHTIAQDMTKVLPHHQSDFHFA